MNYSASQDHETDCGTSWTLARAGVYELLSHLLMHELDLDGLQRLNHSEIRDELASLGVEVPTATPQHVAELEVDFCRIFIGPKEFAAPYQSVWQSGILQGSAVKSMRAFLEIVTPISDQAMPDHAGFQLEVMALILQFENENSEGRDLSLRFFLNHISWTGSLFRRAQLLAQSRFYETLLRAAAEFIAGETLFYEELVGEQLQKSLCESKEET